MFTKTLTALLVALLLSPQPANSAGREVPAAPVEEVKPQPSATPSTTKSEPSPTAAPTVKTVTS